MITKRSVLIGLGSTLPFVALAGQVYPPDVDAIKKRGKLIVAMTSFDNLPFYGNIPTNSTNLTGVGPNIARSLGKMLEVPVEFRRDAKTFSDVVDQVRDDRADIAISKLSITGPRSNVVRFTTPYAKLKQALLVNRVWLASKSSGGKEISEIIKNFDGTLAFIEGSSYDTFARLNFPKATYVPEKNWANIVNGVVSGKYSAGFRDDLEVKKIAFERPEASLTTKAIIISDSSDYIAACVGWKSTHLLSIADMVVSNTRSDVSVNKLISMYRSMSGI